MIERTKLESPYQTLPPEDSKKFNLYIGIDPGISGAITILSNEGHFMFTYDMPVTPKTTGKGNEVNAYLLTQILKGVTERLIPNQVHVAVEAVSAMPGQGVTGMFSFGRSLGVIEGVVAGLGFAITFFRPQKWKKIHNLIGKDKDQARTLALGKWPEAANHLQRKKDAGRADAALIAETLRTQS